MLEMGAGMMKILHVQASPYQERLILTYFRSTSTRLQYAPLTKKQRSELALERQRLLELESKRTHQQALDAAIKRGRAELSEGKRTMSAQEKRDDEN